MQIIESIDQMQACARQWRTEGKTIGFVPTMGALHAGHMQLLSEVRQRSMVSVMSIYVNPTQFGPTEDFTKYPRPFEQDCALARDALCDVVFAPRSTDMYPDFFCTSVAVDKITDCLCGASRPGHFAGVTTVVLKFLNIVKPDIVAFGQKDAQQVLVIKRMLHDLNIDIPMLVVPTVREPDGLAMSSRNRYLTAEEKLQALSISVGIRAAGTLFSKGERSVATLRSAVSAAIDAAPLLRPEYIACVDTITLQPLVQLKESALLAVACRTLESKTRLIDNIILGTPL